MLENIYLGSIRCSIVKYLDSTHLRCGPILIDTWYILLWTMAQYLSVTFTGSKDPKTVEHPQDDLGDVLRIVILCMLCHVGGLLRCSNRSEAVHGLMTKSYQVPFGDGGCGHACKEYKVL
jgi:hypothetical protein